MNYPIRYGGALTRIARNAEFGFVELPDGRTVFVHRNQLPNGTALLVDMQLVFCVVEEPRGLKAVSAEVIGGPEDCAQATLAGLEAIG